MDYTTTQVYLNILTPHPLNASIYGENEDVSSLVELIQQSGWVKPLVVTIDGVIVSGHRRWKAVRQLGWESVPIEVREFPDSVAIIEALLLENASRDRSFEVRIREGMAWETVEKEKARARKGVRTDLTDLVENFPPSPKTNKFGKSRDAIGFRIGLSGRSYSKGRKVIETIGSEESVGNLSNARVLRSALNKSIDAAYKLAIGPPSTREAIANLMEEGKACNVTTAIRLVRDLTEFTRTTKTQSCWNCQLRLESVDKTSIYCNKFGILNLIEKSGDERGSECPEWKDSFSPIELLKKPSLVLTLFLPVEWQDRIEETATSLGIDASVWVTNLIGASLFPPSDVDEGSDYKVKQVSGNGNILHKQKNHSRASTAASAGSSTISTLPPAQFIEHPSGRKQN